MKYLTAKKRILFSFLLFATLLTGVRSQEVATRKSSSKTLSDSALLDLVQRQTFKYFWEFAHPVSGLARERSNITFGYGDEVVTTGGSGFGIMAMIVAAERNWITRDTAARHLLKT